MNQYYVIYNPADGSIKGWGACPAGMLAMQVPINPAYQFIEVTENPYSDISLNPANYHVVSGAVVLR